MGLWWLLRTWLLGHGQGARPVAISRAPALFPFRWWADAASGWGRRQPVPNLHGCSHWLCPAGVWAHGHLHQMWQAHEWVPHLSAVCGASCACFQVMKIEAPWVGHSRDYPKPTWVHKRDWKLTVPRQKLFLKIIFITDWDRKFILNWRNLGCAIGLSVCEHMAFPACAGFYHLSPRALVAEVRLFSVDICSCSMETTPCLYIFPLSCVWTYFLWCELTIH